MKKTITPNEHLQAFALYTMANQHYAKTREFERGIALILGSEDEYNDYVSDGIYSNDAGSADLFDQVLRNAGVAVAKPKRKKRRLKK